MTADSWICTTFHVGGSDQRGGYTVNSNCCHDISPTPENPRSGCKVFAVCKEQSISLKTQRVLSSQKIAGMKLVHSRAVSPEVYLFTSDPRSQ